MQLERLQLKNFKMFRDVVISDIPPLAIFVGANGSGKSTLLEVFGFLRDALIRDIPYALQKHGGFRELYTRGGRGAIEINLRVGMKISNKNQTIDYSLHVGENRVTRESLQCGLSSRKNQPLPLIYESDVSGISHERRGTTMKIAVSSPSALQAGMQHVELAMSEENLALKFLGLVKGLDPVSALRENIENWHLSNFLVDAARTDAKVGTERLSASADNLAAVAQFLEHKHPEEFRRILRKLAQRVPVSSEFPLKTLPIIEWR